MTLITITLNTTFAHLNDDRTLAIKQNASSRERSAICDIVLGNADVYHTGGITLDFSKIRRFKSVYVCEIAHNTYGLNVTFIPAAGNDSATGKLKYFKADGSELDDNSVAIRATTFRVIIRGN